MPRNPLYRSHQLKLDYDSGREVYSLKRDGRTMGSSYRTAKQVASLLVTLRRNIEEDRRFRGIDLKVTQAAQDQLDLAANSSEQNA